MPGKRQINRSEMLTVRFDTRSRFALEFTSRLLGQSMTTVLERALIEYADRMNCADHVAKLGRREIRWQDVWSDCIGEQALRMAELDCLFPTTDDRYKLAFAREHWPFFYTDETCTEYMPFYIDVLWPRMMEFMTIRLEQEDTNWMAAGEAMAQALKDARIEPPVWPPAKKALKR